MTTRQSLIAAIDTLRAAGSPVVAAISGYGGSGKSTLARALVAEIAGSVRLRGDARFLPRDRADLRYAN